MRGQLNLQLPGLTDEAGVADFAARTEWEAAGRVQQTPRYLTDSGKVSFYLSFLKALTFFLITQKLLFFLLPGN